LLLLRRRPARQKNQANCREQRKPSWNFHNDGRPGARFSGNCSRDNRTESTHIVTFWCHEAFLRHRSVGILLHGFGLIAEKFEAQKIRIRQNALALRSAPELRRSDRYTPKMRAKSLWAFIINKIRNSVGRKWEKILGLESVRGATEETFAGLTEKI